jgi:hypothetical protein
MHYNPDVGLKLVRLLAVSLALLIPVQATAALTAGICMSLGHHNDAMTDQSHVEHGGDGADHTTHSHSATDASPGDSGDANAHCGPCTACCASASIAGPVALSLPDSPAHPAYVFSQYPPLGVQPDGLYRPPLAL